MRGQHEQIHHGIPVAHRVLPPGEMDDAPLAKLPQPCRRDGVAPRGILRANDHESYRRMRGVQPLRRGEELFKTLFRHQPANASHYKIICRETQLGSKPSAGGAVGGAEPCRIDPVSDIADFCGLADFSSHCHAYILLALRKQAMRQRSRKFLRKPEEALRCGRHLVVKEQSMNGVHHHWHASETCRQRPQHAGLGRMGMHHVKSLLAK